MSKPKPSKNAPAKPEKEAEAPAEEIEIASSSLNKVQRAFLHRVSRFLVNIQSPRFSARAFKNGYDTAAHAEGWGLWRSASGMNRPLDHWVTELERAEALPGITGDLLRLLQELDTFENTWFPRVRMILRRFVPRDRRDAFTKAFFANLQQQPLGPGVVGSVGGLLQRIAGLEESSEPAAKAILDTLKKRGLTAKKIAEVRARLKEAEEGTKAAQKKPSVSPEELAEAHAAQMEAYESLKDWFVDWATMLRSVFGVRDQLILGLAVRRRGSAGGEIVDTEEGIAEEEADEDLAEDAGELEGEETPMQAKSAPAKEKSGPVKGKGQ